MKSTGIGVFTPKRVATGILRAGEVGYVIAGIKDINGAPVGDTLTHAHQSSHRTCCLDFKKVKPQVYAGLFPIHSDDFPALREALSKLAFK